MIQIIIVIALVRLIIALIPWCNEVLQLSWQKLKQTLSRKKTTGLFDDHFIEPKNYYLKEFKSLPCIHYISNVDTGEVLKLIQTGRFGRITDCYQRNYYNWQQERMEFPTNHRQALPPFYPSASEVFL